MRSISTSIEHAIDSGWEKLRYHAEQHRLWTTTARFVCVAAGRRSGKTELAKRRLILKALGARRPDEWFIAAAPTYAQAKRIFWRDLKRMIPSTFLARRPSESELTIQLITGAEITVMGMDKPERVEGHPLSGIVCDEFANMDPDAWQENIRPALADRKGWAWLQGVPEGRNHFYNTWLDAKLKENKGEWDTFHWLSADILDADEIASARRSLDPLTYQQEFEASFVTFTGLAYYPFSIDLHVKRTTYNPKADLHLMFDFNVSPGVAVIGQEQDNVTTIIDEVYIPRNSNTPAVCRKILSMYENHPGEVYAYGDATGGAAGTAKTTGSDWDIISQYMRRAFGQRFTLRVPESNPLERVRINSVNSRLLSIDNTVSLAVDGHKCRKLIHDFENVSLLEGGSGEIDKDADERITHLTDALGYYVARQHPIRRKAFAVESVA